ncbi:MAG: hypothetical protein ABI685_12655 [Ferruginibacter sp.]
MKAIFLSISLVAFVLTCSAQTNCNIKKAYAYYTVSMPGVQMADENGNPINPKPIIDRFIYIEWCGVKSPKIETILYNNKALIATLTVVSGKTVVAGSELSKDNNTKITVKKNNSLWKIELQSREGHNMPEEGCKNIIIKVKGTNNTCSFKLTKETQLMTMPRY